MRVHVGLLVLSLLVSLSALAGTKATVSFLRGAGGHVTLKVQGAGRTQRVTVPFMLAYKLAYKARHEGGLTVSTARDGFTGNILRIVAGQGKDSIVLDRMRRGGPNGQSGSSALRLQMGVGAGAQAFFIGRTVGVRSLDRLRMVGRSGPSRRGAYPAVQGDISLDTRASADGKTLRWYFTRTGKVTTDVKAPLAPFAP